MYKLLIVDDEQIVIDSVKFIVEKYMGDSLITETARSGREAIEKAELFCPDIVITDIKMPGINGLDAITEIKKIYSGALFIIITAYASFDFAKEALRLGAIEYINKPLSRNKVINALENAVKIKDKERSKLKVELNYKEKMSFILPALEHSFIYSVILSDDHTAELQNLKKMLELESESGFIMTIEFGDGKNADGVINKIGTGIKSQKMYPVLRDAIKETCCCIVGPVMLNRIIIYVPCGTAGDEVQQRTEALEIGNEIYSKIKNVDADVDFFIGIGKAYPALRDLFKSYEESLNAIGYLNESGVLHIDDIPVEHGTKKAFSKSLENALLNKISAGDTEGGLAAFEQLFNRLQEENADHLTETKSSLMELVVLIFRLSKDYEIPGSEEQSSGYINKYLSIDNMMTLKKWVEDQIRRTAGAIAQTREKRFSSVVKGAISYISKNYSRDITLEEVSLKVNVSPTYFSKLFKEETGTNFIDYLTVMRIEKAKQLISENNCGNKKICYLIGYSDPNYFSRVFKKLVGVTPTEYRAGIVNE